MKVSAVTVVLAMVLSSAIGVIAAERPVMSRAEGSSSLVSFVPGPPLWRLPQERPRATVKSTNLEDTIDQCVTTEMAALDVPGAAVAVIVDGELVYENGYGVKRRGGTEAVDAETQFRIGSVTKMFTAAAVMQQVEAGTVFLDDRLSRFVPEFELMTHWPDDTITVERLLTHATGIPDIGFYWDGDAGVNALSDWAASHRRLGLHAPPGTFYNYSNPNFNLAGLVVERASGLPYRQYMENRVFAAAGLTNTTFDPAAVVARGNASDGHWDDGTEETIFAPDGYDNGAYAPAGYAYSTAGDLVRWALLLSDGGGEVLEESSARAMQSPQQSLQTFPGNSYGYGIFVEPFYNLTVRQHGGNIWGWGSFLLWHPERRVAVAVLANTFQSIPGAAYCVAGAVLEPDFGIIVDPAPPDPERWQRLFERRFESSLGVSTAVGNPYPVMGEVSPYNESQLLLTLWDPEGIWNELWILDHQALDVFYVDTNYDGTYDLDLSFITSDGPPEQTRWMRMRPVVGHPQMEPRASGRILP